MCVSSPFEDIHSVSTNQILETNSSLLLYQVPLNLIAPLSRKPCQDSKDKIRILASKEG